MIIFNYNFEYAIFYNPDLYIKLSTNCYTKDSGPLFNISSSAKYDFYSNDSNINIRLEILNRITWILQSEYNENNGTYLDVRLECKSIACFGYSQTPI